MAKKLNEGHERYKAAMVLAGAGDSLGYRCGEWEFNYSGPDIHRELQAFGGLSNLTNELPGFRVSDDTVMHLATAKALVTHKVGAKLELLYNNLAHEYINCMKDMHGRAPGGTCMGSCSKLSVLRDKDPQAKLYRLPFNPRGGGCGAAMRAMCIGLRYPTTADLDQLVAVSVESGRMTHNHPTGYLGALVSALFTAYAIQGKPLVTWGASLVKEVLPKAKNYIEEIGIDVQENLANWSYFENHWKEYLALRQITDGEHEPVFPDAYGVKERDEYYNELSFSGWGGSAGHDSVIIAYDALLGSKGSWDELANRAIFHGGDNDSTGTIAACWFGGLYGFKGVYENNYKEVEYRDKMEEFAINLFELSHSCHE
ncbi:ADP-ribosylhydrolase ARH1-like [Watersipora subatra]|uniref:ADP-ribosylhydrolase ARH1-like n=1 Tax=Watersipora subatra TaxID=2589382 RepID=UPI00355C99E4